MDTNTQELDIKIKNNAMSAYFLIFLCASFLFVKHNPNVDHPFVRSHTKTALSLHSLILFIIALFLWFDLGEGISWHDYHLNFILASLGLIGMLGLLLKGMYAAHNGQEFMISEITHFIKNEKILDINHDSNLDEKDKATIIFSLIPFLGYIVYGKYSDNLLIKNMSHLNLICTLVVSLIYISGYTVAANFLLLLWVIGIVFFSVQIVVKGELLSIDMTRIPSFGDIYETLKLAFLYVKNYFSKSGFKDWQTLKQTRENGRKSEEEKQEEALKKEKNMKLPEWLIYIPLLNIATLFNLDTKKRIHILNGLGVTITFIFSFLVIFYDWNYLFFFLFPMTYGFAFLDTKLNYKLPLFYDIGNGTTHLFTKIKNLLQAAHEIKKTHTQVSLKVEEKKSTDSDEEKK